MTWSTLGSGEESTGVLGEDLVILRDNRGQERVGFLRAVVESRVHLSVHWDRGIASCMMSRAAVIPVQILRSQALYLKSGC